MASRPVRSDWDLRELEAKIADVELQRLRTPDFPPYMFDRFEALCTVRGGMGLVIKARDPQLDRLVAIKLGVRSDGPAQADVIAEAKTLAQLRHENVVMVYDLGVWNDRVYFVMEWIEGVDGHDWMSRQRSWREVRRVFVNAGTGLAAAHDAGIHHRDFKPSNILIGRDGRVVVADFGLAGSLQSSPGPDDSGGVAETALYMAPERLRGKRGDTRSAQFSFCAAMWKALFQQRPFDGQSGKELSAAIERGEIRETPLADVPRWVVDVVRKGLAYDPDERHRDMRTLLAALLDEPRDDAVVDAEVGDDEVAVVDGRVVDKGDAGAVPQRERWPYVAIGFLSALVAVLGLHALTRSSSSEQPTPAAAVQVEPYQALLGLVATDDFARAEQLWLDHLSEWPDAQSLEVAELCLERAKQLAPVDPTKAHQAVLLAGKLAGEVEESGGTPEARKAGGQLVSHVMTWATDRPPTDTD